MLLVRSILVFLAAGPITLAYPKSSSTKHSLHSFYVASQSQGILHIEFDPTKDANHSLSVLASNTNAGSVPNWLEAYGDNIYSISRSNYPTQNSTSGGLFAFKKPRGGDSSRSPLTFLNSESSNGYGGVAIDISPNGRTLAAANIYGPTVSIHPLTSTGTIQPASQVFTYNLSHPGPGANDSQIEANPHQATFDPSGNFMFVADRGADLVYVYAAHNQHFEQIQSITLEPGTGPRHMAFKTYNATRSYMYLVSELDNTVRVFALDQNNAGKYQPNQPSSNITITRKQLISTLGLGAERTAPNNRNMTSEIAISNDGRYAYVSNRNTVSFASDNIAVFAIDSNPGHDAAHLTLLGFNQTYGKIPRHFALSTDPDNRWVVIANQYSQSLVVMERNVTSGFFAARRGFLSLGDLDLTGKKGPICVLWD